jgi:hypothetical protein
MFTIAKPDKTLRSLADLRELNKRIKRKPFPTPKINDLLQKLEGFYLATSLDLNMGYYHIGLTPYASTLCTVVFPWGKYEYLRLPQELPDMPWQYMLLYFHSKFWSYCTLLFCGNPRLCACHKSTM